MCIRDRPDTGLRHAAWLVGPETGIRMETLTTQPGVQVYSANFLNPGTDCKDGAHYSPPVSYTHLYCSGGMTKAMPAAEGPMWVPMTEPIWLK